MSLYTMNFTLKIINSIIITKQFEQNLLMMSTFFYFIKFHIRGIKTIITSPYKIINLITVLHNVSKLIFLIM